MYKTDTRSERTDLSGEVRRTETDLKTGASIIELVVVVSIGMLLMLLSVHVISGLHGLIMHAELALLSATLHAEQQKAVVTGEPRVITFDVDHAGYATKTRKHRLQRGVTFTAPPSALGPPSNPRKPIERPITFTDDKLVCHRYGIIKPGTIYLGDAKNQLFYALTVNVAQHSFVRNYAYREKRWVSL